MCSDVCVALPRTGHHCDLSVCLCEFRYICVFRLNVMACPLTLGCNGSEKPLRSLLMAADTVKWSINPEQSCDKQGVTAEEESHRSASAQL